MSKWHVDGEEVFSPDYQSDRRRISSSISYLPGDWYFFGTPGATAPKSGMQVVLPEHTPYIVRVTLFCEATDCDPLKQEIATMRAPRVTGDATLVDAWHNIVEVEKCNPLLPPARPSVRYPPEELRRSIEGAVTLSIYHNRCGDVRDAVVNRSSGNRNLDKAAVNGVLRWRVEPGKVSTAGWKSERVEFRLDDPSNPTINSFDIEGEPSSSAHGSAVQRGAQ